MIPCLNEEQTLPQVLKEIPRKIKGVESIELLVIDDGSTDKTSEIARNFGVDHILTHTKNLGLSRSFRDGLNYALELGADIIVNTEGDNQYPGEKIPDLIKPILNHEADLVISDRQTQTIDHFSATKKFWQKVGTYVLNIAAGTKVPDAISGFRAYSRLAALQLNPIADYSWATETTIQAANKGQKIAIMPITTNPKLRESRQFKSNWQHIRRSSVTIVRAYIMYRPYAVFLSIGTILLILGLIPFIHFAYLIFTAKASLAYGPHHIQSLITGSVLLIGAFFSYSLGVIADLIRINRALAEKQLELIKRSYYSKK